MNVTLGNHVERATKSVRKLSNVDTEETNRLALYLQENQIWDQVQCRFAGRKKSTTYVKKLKLVDRPTGPECAARRSTS